MPRPYVSVASSAWMQAALGISDVQELLIHPALKYVLLVLPHGTTQEQLQSIKPNFVQLKAAATVEQIVGVIVTCSGQIFAQTCVRSHLCPTDSIKPQEIQVSWGLCLHDPVCVCAAWPVCLLI